MRRDSGGGLAGNSDGRMRWWGGSCLVVKGRRCQDEHGGMVVGGVAVIDGGGRQCWLGGWKTLESLGV